MEMPALIRRHLLLSGLGLGFVTRSQAGLVDVIATAKQSVAAVGTFSALDSPRFTFRGTGFVVADGSFLITNAHVLPDPVGGQGKSTLAVQFDAGGGSLELRPAIVARLDTIHDLALLRFEGSARPAFRIADSEDIHEGLAVALIGFPIGGVLGFRPVTHRGIISSITAVALPPANSQQLNEKTVRRLREGSFDVYQLDATAYPGNSGGPLLNADTGELVGVVNMVLVKSTKESALSQPTGITYAIPARFVDELIRRRE
jgi:Trypsin-like serine proteases, typically periplasmic, contain C-terminal PDZ domain